MDVSKQVFTEVENLWQAIECLQEEIGYSHTEALGETLQNFVQQKNVQQIDGVPTDQTKEKLEHLYQKSQLEHLTKDAKRKVIQFLCLKANKQDQLQQNHQMTPDAISMLSAYMMSRILRNKSTLVLGDYCAGVGNLLHSVAIFLEQEEKELSIYAQDNDEVLTHIGSQSSTLLELPVQWYLQDSIQYAPQSIFDAFVSEVPVGYYPIDDRVKDFETRHEEGHSFAHYVLMEQMLRALKPGGVGLFIVPNHIFEEISENQLMKYLQKESYIQAMLQLPSSYFKQSSGQKAILIVQKHGKDAKQVSQILLGDIPEIKNTEKFLKYTQIFEKWSQEWYN